MRLSYFLKSIFFVVTDMNKQEQTNSFFFFCFCKNSLITCTRIYFLCKTQRIQNSFFNSMRVRVRARWAATMACWRSTALLSRASSPLWTCSVTSLFTTDIWTQVRPRATERELLIGQVRPHPLLKPLASSVRPALTSSRVQRIWTGIRRRKPGEPTERQKLG